MNNGELRRKLQLSEEWYSPPFYTHPHGYRMCLEVHCNGKNMDKGSHVSLFVNLIQGEYDEQLKWPFCGEVTIQLLNQEDGRVQGLSIFVKELKLQAPVEVVVVGWLKWVWLVGVAWDFPCLWLTLSFNPNC
jgi:hypothetical protein